MKDMDTTMSIAKAATQAPPQSLVCPWCTGPVDVKSRHVTVAGSAIRIYCSEDCRLASASGILPLPAEPAEPPAPPRRRWLHVSGIIFGLATLALFMGGREERLIVPQEQGVAAVQAPAQPAEPPAPLFGPAWPPTEEDWLADLAQDAWIHPLGGPERRMPKHHSRVFGAERPGDRPAECMSGHCGVDLGGEVWGEHILAVHDGVVDRVNRGPNEERGGVYVRIAHRQGTVFTQYFHLAAVPRWIKEGVEIQAGQVIGLLGDTGVHHSAPHLHFTISVKPSKDLPEQYVDPEPLIALWPVWMPEGMGAGRVSVLEPPGLPVRGQKKAKKKKSKVSSTEAAFVDTAPSEEAATPTAPAPETSAPAP
jgi:murein DD-endopeptidase MepM/ murein hydrolase activator NlpD